MSWFKRHLHWTLLVILFIGVMLYAVADMVSWYIVLRISGLIVMLVAQIWYLTKKGRSLGWLLLNLIGGVAYAGGSHAGIEYSIFLAGLIMLCLKNKRQETSKVANNQPKEVNGKTNEENKRLKKGGNSHEN